MKTENIFESGKDFYTVNEAAKLLNISENVLRQYIRDKKLKAHKKFNRWYIFKSDIEIFLKS